MMKMFKPNLTEESILHLKKSETDTETQEVVDETSYFVIVL